MRRSEGLVDHRSAGYSGLQRVAGVDEGWGFASRLIRAKFGSARRLNSAIGLADPNWLCSCGGMGFGSHLRLSMCGCNGLLILG